MRSEETKVNEYPMSVWTKVKMLTFLQVRDVAARQGNANFVNFGGGGRGASGVVFLISFGDVTHCE